MSITDDVDCDELISHLAGPLSPPDRIAFRRAAEEALTEGYRHTAEVCVSVGMGGIGGQNLAIRCLSLLQPSGPMLGETPLKQITLRPSGPSQGFAPLGGRGRWMTSGLSEKCRQSRHRAS